MRDFRQLSVGGFELLKEADIVLGEHAEVLDLIFQVGYALHTHTEGETAVDLGVDAAGFEHIRVDHAAAEDFDPACVLAERAPLAAAEVAGDIHLCRRLGEGEVARTQTDFGLRAEHFLSEVKKGLTEVGKRYVLVDI